MAKGTCTVDDCARVRRARDFCDMHYQRLRKYGSVDLPIRPTNEELFWAKVDKQGPTSTHRSDLGPCWIRTAWVQPSGYAFWQVGRRGKTLAHRYSFELAYGPIATGLHIDHLCRVRACVRPSHLEAVTQAENNRRAAGVRVRKTHCPRGHEYAGANLYVTPNKQHACRTCRREQCRVRADRRKAALA